MPRKRTKQAAACLEYYNKLHFNFVCPCCNVKTKLNQFNTHSKTKKHLHLMDIFRQDNPDFKESVFLIKIANLKKLFTKCTNVLKEIDMEKHVNYILTTEPSLYQVDDYIEDVIKKQQLNKYHLSY